MIKIFRKIHLWLSVPFDVFITLVCFSGAMLVYEPETTQSVRHDLYYVDEVKAAPLSIDSLMARVQAMLPDSVQAMSITVCPGPDRTWQVALSKPRRASVFVDPYTGEVKGRNERLPFFDTMFRLHRWLLGPSQTADGGMPAGKWLVGTSVLMLVVILITGILMWLCNKHKPLRKSLTIKINKGWHRFWHDLHVAGGIYATIFLLAMALTGLKWSFGWYRSGFYGLFGVETSADGGHHGSRPSGKDGGRHDGRQGGRDKGRGYGHGRPDSQNAAETSRVVPNPSEKPMFAHWQQVFEQVAKANARYRQITISDGTAGVVPEGRRSLRATDTYDFDPQTGRLTANRPYAEADRGTHVRAGVYMVHTGSWLGWLTRLLNFLAALIGATLPLTGYYLWIKHHLRRRQNGRNKQS